MDSAIDTFLLDEIEVGSFPSAVYAIGSSQRIEAENAPGCAVTVPLRLRAGVDTIYDCASITKTLCRKRFENGRPGDRLLCGTCNRGFPVEKLVPVVAELRVVPAANLDPSRMCGKKVLRGLNAVERRDTVVRSVDLRDRDLERGEIVGSRMGSSDQDDGSNGRGRP